MDLDLIKGVGPATKEKLHEAGVTNVEDLAKGDKDTLSEATGVPAGRIQSFIVQAQGLLAAETTADEEAPEATIAEATPAATPAPAAEPAPTPTAAPTPEPARTPVTVTKPIVDAWRVVLKDRAATARVDTGAATYENLPIVTAKLEEDEDVIMREIGYNAVLLKERATTASVRVNDAWRNGVPIFKERVLDARQGVAELTRVRVHEIRDTSGASPTSASNGKTPAEAPTGKPEGFLGKALGKK
jgi:hypothetical protein